MKEIKFKYYYKNTITKEVVNKIRDIETIEDLEFQILNLEYGHLELLGRCQYTGTKDKNKNEIYENDILKTGEGKIVKVFFKDGCFLYKNDGDLWSINPDYVEIIGNVYEDSELLKEED